MELLGKHYIIEHAVEAENERQKKEAFSFYVSEMMRSLTNSVSHAVGGSEFPKSFKEMLDYKPETRTAGEIKSQVLSKLKKLGGS